jgi:ParB family chromosome partitioning protein
MDNFIGASDPNLASAANAGQSLGGQSSSKKLKPGKVELQVLQISTESLIPGSAQPRTHFDSESITQLAQSIESFGVLQPIIVRKTQGSNYEIIAGERRWRAAKLAQIKEVPCIVRSSEDDDTLEVALIENIQRRDLTPIEEAKALADLISLHHYTHEELSNRLGLTRSNVTNTIRLLQLPETIREYVNSGNLSGGHAKALLMVESAAQKESLAKLVIEKGLSVRKTEELARIMQSEKAATPSLKPKISPNLRHLCDQYKGHLGTKVKITGDQERGRIEISYYSQEDLDRITELVLGADSV